MASKKTPLVPLSVSVPVTTINPYIIDSSRSSAVARSVSGNMWQSAVTPPTIQPAMYFPPPRKQKPSKCLKLDHAKEEILMLQTVNDQQKQEIRNLRHKLKEEERLRVEEKEKSEKTIKKLLEKLDMQMVTNQQLVSQRKRAKSKLEAALKECESMSTD
ncbi:hypothetical protein Ocin01_03267 [Orchesella cincta]|uniref:Uncharacterized protein n=1 Tax=Orchesella cincta TaxID=48709 RepID=A0A1D2NDS4_ORCCI|nr:hypothetical protein Ocin01_03267 [Orchesella cincta]